MEILLIYEENTTFGAQWHLKRGVILSDKIDTFFFYVFGISMVFHAFDENVIFSDTQCLK